MSVNCITKLEPYIIPRVKKFSDNFLLEYTMIKSETLSFISALAEKVLDGTYMRQGSTIDIAIRVWILTLINNSFRI